MQGLVGIKNQIIEVAEVTRQVQYKIRCKHGYNEQIKYNFKQKEQLPSNTYD